MNNALPMNPTDRSEAVSSYRKPVTIIEPSDRFSGYLRELWDHHELLYFLAWRDIKVRYKQTVIGVLWAILQPVLTMVVFTAIFGKFARIPSEGVPYPIFAYTALVPWQFFANSLTRAITSVVTSANLISKVYFPRLLVPLSAPVSGTVDFAIAFVILLIMMVWFGIAPTWRILTVPLFWFQSVLTALAAGLWLSALHARYRDVGHALSFLVQLWMFASPVVYPVSLVKEVWRPLYSLNPMVGVIEGFRWAILGRGHLDVELLFPAVILTLALLSSGAVYFRRVERTLPDVI